MKTINYTEMQWTLFVYRLLCRFIWLCSRRILYKNQIDWDRKSEEKTESIRFGWNVHMKRVGERTSINAFCNKNGIYSLFDMIRLCYYLLEMIVVNVTRMLWVGFQEWNCILHVNSSDLTLNRMAKPAEPQKLALKTSKPRILHRISHTPNRSFGTFYSHSLHFHDWSLRIVVWLLNHF